MLSFDRLLAFAALATVIIVIPGPSVLFVVGRALAYGRRTALISVVGNELGALVLVAFVAFGLGSLVARSATLFMTIKLAGAAYLVYLGIRAIRARKSLLTITDGSERKASRSGWEGFVVGMTNPKSAVFFAAVLPQFVNRAAGQVPLQMVVLGAVFVVIALVSDGIWGVAAGTARDWFAGSPRRMSAVGGAGGLAMIGLGITVAVTGRKN